MHPSRIAITFCSLSLTLCLAAAHEPASKGVAARFAQAEPASASRAARFAATLCRQAFLGSDAEESPPIFGPSQVELIGQGAGRVWSVALEVSRAGMPPSARHLALFTRCVIETSSGTMHVKSVSPPTPMGP